MTRDEQISKLKAVESRIIDATTNPFYTAVNPMLCSMLDVVKVLRSVVENLPDDREHY